MGIVRNLRIFVPANAHASLTSISVNGDVVDIAKNYGGTPTLHRVVDIIREDAGGWELRLE
jgi:hypothetical protein